MGSIEISFTKLNHETEEIGLDLIKDGEVIYQEVFESFQELEFNWYWRDLEKYFEKIRYQLQRRKTERLKSWQDMRTRRSLQAYHEWVEKFGNQNC